MKKVTKLFMAALITSVLFLSVQGVLRADAMLVGDKCYASIPAGYNTNDYLKLVSFLDYSEHRGESNGLKLNEAYDPALPETWCEPAAETRSGSMESAAIEWREVGGEKRLVRLDLPFLRGFCGPLDLSGCSELEYLCFRDNMISSLDVSDCASLVSLICYRNNLDKLDVSSCPELSVLAFQENSISQIDVSNNPMLNSLCCDSNGISVLDLSHNHDLTELRCENNALTSLDLSNNPKLSWLWTSGNPIKELDLSSNPKLCLSRLNAVGEGTVSYYGNEFDRTVSAEMSSDNPFEGWFNARGELVSKDAVLNLNASSSAELTAVFGGDSTKGGGGGAAYPFKPYLIKARSNPLAYIIIGCIAAALAAVCVAAAVHRKRKNKVK